MNRRTLLARLTGGIVLFPGCVTNQLSGPANDTTGGDSSESTPTPAESVTESVTVTSETTRRADRACNGARYLSFYALEGQFADQLWDPDRVRVAFSLGAGAHVILVVYENDKVLGTAQATTPSDGGVSVDGMSIPLNTKLSGEHTIRVVVYGDANKNGQFDAKTATPCRYEGNVVQTEPETIDFSAFSDDLTVTPRETGG